MNIYHGHELRTQITNHVRQDMLKTNRFLKYWQGFSLLFLSLSLLSVSASVLAEETETKAEQKFSLEVKDNLITLQAEQASFKEILSELEKKTGIKVNIFKGVVDRKAIEI